MSPTDTHSHDQADGHDNHSGVYLRTLIILLILTVITVGASYIQFGSGSAKIFSHRRTLKGRKCQSRRGSSTERPGRPRYSC